MQIIERQVDDMVEGMSSNAGRPPRRQEADCPVGSSNVGIMLVIVGWDVVWARLVVFGHGWLETRYRRPK